MAQPTHNPAPLKTALHPRNLHREQYDFAALMLANPALVPFVKPNIHGNISIDFANPMAVKALNQALLIYFYQIQQWDIPPHYLCPPIPGRADYIHYLADLLSADQWIKANKAHIKVLDIGVGANMIYPLIATRVYGWQCVGTDIDATAIQNAQHMIDINGLANNIELRLQKNPLAIFAAVFKDNEHFTATLCNPPFHASLAEAAFGTARKLRGLNKTSKATLTKPTLNFGGQQAELYCEGGELGFLSQMIQESQQYASQCVWFTTLVSKSSHLLALQQQLKEVKATDVKVIKMQQGQKQSRLLAWSFISQHARSQEKAKSFNTA
jgi:23S rRNA (adenine1618-N6)-methyltransferase